MRPEREVQFGPEHLVGAEQRLDAHRGDDVGRAAQVGQVGAGQDQHPEHAVGTVDEAEALLRLKLDGDDPGPLERDRTGDRLVLAGCGLALTREDERTMGERGQVPAAAERSVLGHHRGDAGVQHGRERLGHHGPDASAARGERLQPQEHKPPDHLALHRRPEAGGVRPDEAQLQSGAQVGRDMTGGQRPEAGGYAVGGYRRSGQALDHAARGGDLRQGGRCQPHPGAVAGDGHDVSGGGAGRPEDDLVRFVSRHPGLRLVCPACPTAPASHR